MKVLVIGGGGREHAICRALAQSPGVTDLLCAPGNGGIGEVARCFPGVKATDIDGILALCRAEAVDYVAVIPDDPLALGTVDRLREAGIRCFGPTRKAAQMESSKTFAKALMDRAGIPTAAWQSFDRLSDALSYLHTQTPPVVIKSDGLALGKGVIIADTLAEGAQALREIMDGGRFGEAGRRVVIEECLEGPEVTLMCFCDGKALVPMLASQDHKRALDGDRGENTGGMGAFAPTPTYTPAVAARVEAEILAPTLAAMQEAGLDFRGVLYVGLMLTAEGPKVIEYNARFGDPETQVVLPLLENDLLEVMQAVSGQRLCEVALRWKFESAACVVLASGGYPGPYDTGKKITGIEEAEALDTLVFQAGTARQGNALVTAGGRVLCVTALAPTLGEAVEKAYRGADAIDFEQKHLRRDIGAAFPTR